MQSSLKELNHNRLRQKHAALQSVVLDAARTLNTRGNHPSGYCPNPMDRKWANAWLAIE